MNELIKAAKAVIDGWDNYGGTTMAKVKLLRDAAERAETVPTEFEEYWITQGFVAEERQTVLTIWSDAQQAERERLRQKVAEIIRLEDFDDVMDVFRD